LFGLTHGEYRSNASIPHASTVEDVPLFELSDLNPEPQDLALGQVVEFLRASDPDGARMSRVLRGTFDQLYDGQHTGRYHVGQLFKTEKTHFGTLVEINLQREFSFGNGNILDYLIVGHEVDCKFSHSGAWMLPMESFDQLILVLRADDQTSLWSAGVVRVTTENRRDSENRDKKTGLNALGRSRIIWLQRDARMQPNALLELANDEIGRIFAPTSGQKRLNELFRIATNRRLTRNIVATVAQQDDYMKRVRNNGGSRSALAPEGFVILSGDFLVQRRIAENLGATVPKPGEFVSVQIVPTDSKTMSAVSLDGRWWRLAREDDEITTPAPSLTNGI
jgi:hypothetical protein